MNVLRAALTATLFVISSPLVAAPCGGFTDVDDSNPAYAPFCENVEWIKNRGITQGCAPGLYCPDQNVTRLQMAALLNRMGTALRPVFLHKTEPFTVELSFPVRQCVTDAYVVTGHARIASGVGSFQAGLASSPPIPFTMGGLLVLSVDGGTTWQLFAPRATTAFGIGGASGTSVAAPALLPVGTSVQFGVQVETGGIELSSAHCDLTVRLDDAGT